MLHKYVLTGIALATFAGCASAQPPSDKVVAAQSAIRAAEEVGAAKVPDAALHLELARQQTDRAQKLIKEEEFEAASFLLSRAEADAELSLALARSSTATAEAEQAKQRAEQLQQSITPAPAPAQTP